MRILWLGVGLGPRTQEKLLSMGGQIKSAQVSERNLLGGLKALDLIIDTINGPQLSPSLFSIVENEIWQDEVSECNVMVGYKNIQYVNRLSKEKAICLEAEKWAVQHKNEKEIVVFVYSMHTPFLRAAIEVKKIIPSAKIAMIVMDLPQFMDLKMGTIKKVLKKLDWNRICKLLPMVDKYILYAEPMASYLHLKREEWMVMEGSFDSEILGRRVQNSTFSVMYSGVLDLRYGIPELLDAMEMLDPNIELWITGDGNAKKMVEERAKKNKRIIYLGFLPSRQALLDKQASATMLISPRRDLEEASKYCFPSKLFEYMASGNPVISCYLAGIPKEYRKYMIELKEVSAKEIASTIKKVMEMPAESRNILGNKAKQFVLEQKNKYVQSKKMMDFIMQ